MVDEPRFIKTSKCWKYAFYGEIGNQIHMIETKDGNHIKPISYYELQTREVSNPDDFYESFLSMYVITKSYTEGDCSGFTISPEEDLVILQSRKMIVTFSWEKELNEFRKIDEVSKEELGVESILSYEFDWTTRKHYFAFCDNGTLIRIPVG